MAPDIVQQEIPKYHEGWSVMSEHEISKNSYVTALIGNLEKTKRSTKTMKRKYENSDDTQERAIRSDELSSKKRKTEKAVLKRSATMENYMKRKVESCKHLVSDTSSEDEDVDLPQRYSKRYLMSMVETLKEENRRLRADNARLRAFRIVDQDLPEMEKLSEEILRNLRETSALIRLRASAKDDLPENSERDCLDERDTIASDTVSNEPNFTEQQLLLLQQKPEGYDVTNAAGENSRGSSPVVEGSPSSSMIRDDRGNFRISSALQNFEEKIVLKPDPDRLPIQNFEEGITTKPDLESFPFNTPEKDITRHEDFRPEDDQKNLLVDLGAGCIVDVGQLAKCSRKNAAKMTCDMMSLFFTREDLATSSLTGKVPNTHKGITAKKKLDPAKIGAIAAFVMKEFPVRGTRDEIFTAIKNKCNNTSKAMRKEREKMVNGIT